MRSIIVISLYFFSFLWNPFHHWPFHHKDTKTYSVAVNPITVIEDTDDLDAPYDENGVSRCTHDSVGWWAYEPDWTIGYSSKSCIDALHSGNGIQAGNMWQYWHKNI